MKKIFTLFFVLALSSKIMMASVVIPNVWINEIHYDNVGIDTLEGFEIAGPAGTNLGCFRVFLYNGANGQVYLTDTLSGIIPNEACGFGTVWFPLPQDGIQNGDPDGIVLEYASTALQCVPANQDTILQFLSYDGAAFMATNGRANGLTSTDIVVNETATTPVGHSIQLTGTGTSYAAFTWAAQAASTYNTQNNFQYFCAVNPVVQFDSVSSSVSEGTATLVVSLSIQNPNNTATSVDVNIMGGATATSGIDFGYAPVTVTFPASTTASQNIVITLTDDAVAEGNESFTFQLAFPTNNATVGTNAQHTVTIIDNDTSKLNIGLVASTQNENAGTITFPVSMSTINATNVSTTVHLNASGTTATQASDFIFSDTTITWLAGDTATKNISLTIVDDNLYELAENVKLQLINTTSGVVLLNDTFLLTILDNDALPSGNCSDLYFSEYIEGSANNKAIEIYNPTNTAINLNDYRIFKSQNGNAGSVFSLSGSLAANSVYVAANSSAGASVTNQADATSSFFDFDGNDALYLLHLNDTIDVIGQSWIDPGANGWMVGTGSTNQHTLIRSFYHYHGNTIWDSAVLWWNSYSVDMFDSLGVHHTAPCGTGVPFIPATIHFTKGSDTIMEQNTTYYFGALVDNHSGYSVHFSLYRDDVASTATQGYPQNFDYFFEGGSYDRDTGTFYDSLHIDLHDDFVVERTEKIIIRVGNVGLNGIAIPDSVFTLYILDNDSLTTSFYGAGLTHIENDTDVLVPLVLSSYCADSLYCDDTTASVHITLDAGSAIPGVDFSFTDTIITFKTNRADTLGAWVHIFDDAIIEGNEQINFNLTNLTSGIHTNIIGYTLTIIDNDTPLGFSEEEFDANMKLYPNPASNFITISTEQEQTNVRITDLLGNEVINLGKLDAGKNQIGISALSSGMYFVCVNDSGKLMSKRFVKSE